MEKDPHKAVDFIITHAPKYAQAKANRVHIENYLRVVKSELMLTQDEGTQGIKEAYAYSNPHYKQQLDALKIATEEEAKEAYNVFNNVVCETLNRAKKSGMTMWATGTPH